MLLKSLPFTSRGISRFRQVQSANQVSIFDPPTDIITHQPSLGVQFPFHKDAFLFNDPIDPSKIASCHTTFCNAIREASNARIWGIREVLSQLPVRRLREFIISQSGFKFRITPDIDLSHKALQQEYLEESLSGLSKDRLIDLVMLHPQITVDVTLEFKAGRTEPKFVIREIPIEPLANLVFTRDQQIVTAGGVVIGRFGAPQRRAETEIMALVWEQLGVNPIARLKGLCELEGGDFFPLGKDLALLGVGQRTNVETVEMIVQSDVVRSSRIVVVEDTDDFDLGRSHLDTFFSPIDEKLAICFGPIARDEGPYRRIAQVWEKQDDRYVKTTVKPFGRWLEKEGYHIVPITRQQQEEYFTSNLTLGRNAVGKMKLFVTNPKVETLLKEHGFDGRVYATDFSAITSMAGGVHSVTQALRQGM
jgi:arginine deiminase